MVLLVKASVPRGVLNVTGSGPEIPHVMHLCLPLRLLDKKHSEYFSCFREKIRLVCSMYVLMLTIKFYTVFLFYRYVTVYASICSFLANRKLYSLYQNRIVNVCSLSKWSMSIFRKVVS